MSLFDHPHMRFGTWIEESIPGALFVKIVCPCPALEGQPVPNNNVVWLHVINGDYKSGIGKVMSCPQRIAYLDLNDIVEYCFDYENGRHLMGIRKHK